MAGAIVSWPTRTCSAGTELPLQNHFVLLESCGHCGRVVQGVRVTELMHNRCVISYLHQSPVLQDEQQLLQSPVLRGLVCNVETGRWFWFEALALFQPLNLIIWVMWMWDKWRKWIYSKAEYDRASEDSRKFLLPECLLYLAQDTSDVEKVGFFSRVYRTWRTFCRDYKRNYWFLYLQILTKNKGWGSFLCLTVSHYQDLFLFFSFSCYSDFPLPHFQTIGHTAILSSVRKGSGPVCVQWERDHQKGVGGGGSGRRYKFYVTKTLQCSSVRKKLRKQILNCAWFFWGRENIFEPCHRNW